METRARARGLTRLPLLALAVLAGPLARTAPAVAPQAEDSAGPTALLIDGHAVPVRRFEDWLLLNRGEVLAPVYAELWLARRETKKLGLAVDPAEIQRRVEAEYDARIQGAFDGDRNKWLNELSESGRSLAGRTSERSLEIEHILLLEAIASVGRTISPEALRAEWELAYGRGGRKFEVRLFYRRMTLSSVRGETKEERDARRDKLREDTRAFCLDVLERARAGEELGQLALDLSHDAGSKFTRGVPKNAFSGIGWPAQALDGIAALQPGEISAPLQARGGFWLVELRGVTFTPFEDVEKELRQSLLERGPAPDEVTAVRRRLAEDAKVEVQPAMYAEVGEGALHRPPEETVLLVDGTALPRSQYAGWMRRFRGELNLTRFKEQWKLVDAARLSHIEVPESLLQARVEEDLQRTIDFFHGGDREEWLTALERTGRAEATFRREARMRARGELIADELLRGKRIISEAAIRMEWENRYGQNGHKIDVRWIRLDMQAPEPDPTVSRDEWRKIIDRIVEETKQEALGLRKRVENGEDFETLARKHSDDPDTRDRGGAPRNGYDPRRFPPEAVEQIESLPIGGLTQPTVVASHVYLIEVTNIKDISLESVRDALHDELQNRRATSIELAALKRDLTEGVKLEVQPAMFR